jgi:hypothetical protein
MREFCSYLKDMHEKQFNVGNNPNSMRPAAFGLVVILAGCATIAPQRAPSAILAPLQTRDAYLENKFLGPPGASIPASREEGMRVMMHVAGTARNELAMLYLPERGVWITYTLGHSVNMSEIGLDYIPASDAEPQEFWHTHNDVDVDYGGDKESNLFYWIAPSVNDLQQLYALGATRPKVKGVIATEYGALSYWSDEYNVAGGLVDQLDQVLREEAARLQTAFRGATKEELAARAQSYRGVVWLRFETPAEPARYQSEISLSKYQRKSE